MIGGFEWRGESEHQMLDANGVLQEDFDLGMCTPSLAGVVVMNAAISGWQYWKNSKGESLDIYRK